MNCTKKQIIILALTTWVVILLTFMVLSSTINLEILFVLWLIGLLVILELADFIYLQPKYIKYIKMLSAAGVLVFGLIVILKIVEIIAK